MVAFKNNGRKPTVWIYLAHKSTEMYPLTSQELNNTTCEFNSIIKFISCLLSTLTKEGSSNKTRYEKG
jgi:hypothetical protein